MLIWWISIDGILIVIFNMNIKKILFWEYVEILLVKYLLFTIKDNAIFKCFCDKGSSNKSPLKLRLII